MDTLEVAVRPLSGAQLAILITQQLDPDDPSYNIAEYIEIFGPVNTARFAAAVHDVVMAAGALHLRVTDLGDRPHQYVSRNADWTLAQVDLTTAADPEAAARAWMQEDMARVPDPGRGPLFSYTLFRVDSERYFWYARNYHICNDAAGGALVAQRVAQRYAALADSDAARVPVPAESGFELLDYEGDYRISTAYERDRAYWRQQMAELPPAVTLSGRAPMRCRGFARSSGFLPRAARHKFTRGAHRGGSALCCASHRQR
jgi:nonribosomal peptide synthetase DhbF